VSEKPVACAQDNLIRQIPRLRESLSALDDEIHSEMSKPDHAETMRIHSKILQLQDKRMNEVEGRLNTLARDGDEKSALYEQLHHASGARILAMSEELKEMHGEVDLHSELHHATGERVLGMARQVEEPTCSAHARTVDQQLRDLTHAGEISRDLLKDCQERLGDVSSATRKAQQAQDGHRQVQSELGDMRQDMNELTRKVEQATGAKPAPRQLQGERSAAAASVSNEALLRQVAVSVIDIQKMLGASSEDVALLGRKVEKMEAQLDTTRSHAATFNLLQQDMLSNRPKKTRS
jgi:CII-binding regulator of phage lambda lysogenization HflD